MTGKQKWNWKRSAAFAAAFAALLTIAAAGTRAGGRPGLGSKPSGAGSAAAAQGGAEAPSDLPLYRIRPAETRVSFTVTKLGVFKVEGRFRDVQGKIAYDPARPEASRVGIRIATASLDTSEPDRDETVRSSDFLDAARYPEMAFAGRKVEKLADGTLRLHGDLTIRGITRPVVMPVKVLGLAPNPGGKALVGFEAELTVDRRDFGVLGTRWSGGRALIGNDVSIHIVVGAEERS